MPTDLPASRHRVFLVDDHVVLRDCLREMINQQSDMIVSGEAAGMEESLAAIAASPPDLVVVDLTLAQGSGLELLEHLRKERANACASRPATKPITPTGACAPGRRGYVMKTQSLEETLEGIRRVLAGDINYSNSVVTTFVESFGLNARDNRAPIDRLSRREFEVFEFLGAGTQREGNR